MTHFCTAILKTDFPHRIASALLAIVIGFFLTANSVFAQNNAALPYTAEDLPTGTFFFGAYDNKGQKYGYKRVEYEFFTADDGKPMFSERSMFVTKFVNLNRQIRYTSVSTMEHFFSVDDGLELAAAQHNDKITHASLEDGEPFHTSESRTMLLRNGNSLHVIRSSNGKDRTWKIPAPGLTAYEFVAGYFLFRSNPSVGDQARFRYIDFDDLSMVEPVLTVEAVNTVSSGNTETLEFTCSVEMPISGIRGECIAFESGLMDRMTFQSGWSLVRESESVATDSQTTADFSNIGIVPIDRALPDPFSLSSIQLKVTGQDAQRMFKDTPNQRVEVISDDHLVITLKNGVSNYEDPETGDSDNYLMKTPLYAVEHPLIQKKANDLTQDLSTQEEKIARLVAFVDEHIEDDSDADSEDVIEVFVTQKGDCTEHALLFITLARAAGIPARRVHGYIYNEDRDSPGFAGHAWAEVLVDDHWKPVDPSWGQSAASIGHLQEYKSAAIPGAFEIRVIDYKKQHQGPWWPKLMCAYVLGTKRCS
jgi:hypothetical protein